MESALEDIGLNRQQVLVYLSTLKLGVAKASDIAAKAGVQREAVYYILRLLQEKGFVSEVIKSGVKHYNAVSSKRILEILEEEKQRKMELIQGVLTDLDALQKVALVRPKIEVYEGVEGFKTIVAKLVEKENQEIVAYVPEKTLHFLPTFHLQFRRKRKEKNVRMRVISENTKFMRDIKKIDAEELREIRFNDAIIKGIEAAYFILADAVVTIRANDTEQLGVYIKEEHAAKMQKNIFELVWKASRQ